MQVSLFGFGFTCLFRKFNSNTSCIVIKQKLHCCYYADINTIVFPILPNLNSEYLFLRHFCIYLYLVLVLLVYFANLTVLHHTLVIKQKLHCCYYADINTIVFPILPNLNSEYLFLRHFCIYLYLVLVLLVYFANLTVLHHTLVIKQKLEPEEDHLNLFPKHHKQSSPKADLKTSPHVTVHIK